MKIQLYTAPIVEPITLTELLLHLRHESQDIATALTTSQSIAPGSHAIADNYTTHVGTSVNVLGKTAIVNLNAGAVGEGGKVDAKIQESNDEIAWSDWTGGAFTQVTAANGNAIQEKQYTGSMAYIRVVAKVTVAACEFGADILTITNETIEDDWLNDAIAEARVYIEDITRRKIMTQIWDYYLDEWPKVNYIKIPFGNLQNGDGTAPVISWKDTDGAETTLTVEEDYIVETNGEQCGRIVLPYGGSWPSGTLYPSNPIKIRFVCGWTSADLVSRNIKAMMKLYCAYKYAHRGERLGTQESTEDMAFYRLRMLETLWDEF